MSESTEQQALFAWVELAKQKYPELELLHAIPNGGKRDIITATRLKREGTKAGVPDIYLPIARSGYHGLYIELKIKGGRLSDSQKWWIDKLSSQGYSVHICYGLEEAIDRITWYLNL